MKYCPTCREIYDDAQRFCERDGTPIRPITAAGAHTQAPPKRSGVAGRSYTSSHLVAVGAIGLIIGIAVVMTAMMGAFSLTRSDDHSSEDGRSSEQQINVREQRSAPPATKVVSSAIPLYTEAAPTPSPTPSPSPDVELVTSASPAAGEGSGESKSAEVSSRDGAESRGGYALIRLKDGASIEADEVWEDRYGFWYRRGGLVARVERGRIASVKQMATTPAPSAQPIVEMEAAKARPPALQVVEP